MDQQEKEVATLLRQRRLFSEMIETEAWKELVRIATAQMEGHLSELMKPPLDTEGQLDVLQTYYRKGAVFGIKVLIGTPAATIQTAEELQTDRQPRSYENAERRSDRPRQQPDLFDADVELGPDTRITDLSGE